MLSVIKVIDGIVVTAFDGEVPERSEARPLGFRGEPLRLASSE
jgi:hypothetical protein